MVVRRLVAAIVSIPVCFVLITTSALAQRGKPKPPPPPPVVTPQVLCPGTCSVSVTPKGNTDTLRWANSSGGYNFTVQNTGDVTDTWSFTCTATTPVTCSSVQPTGKTLTAGASWNVLVTYATGNPGNGTIKLKASSSWSKDSATLNIPVGRTVIVTPKNQAPISVTPSVNQQLTFDVYDSALVSDTYTLTCSITGSETCVSVVPSSLSLSSHQHGSATLTYTSGSSGTTGTVQFKAQSTIYGTNVRDSSTYSVWNGPGPTPTVSLAPYSSARHNASSFDGTAAHATPAYWSMGAPRSLVMSYNASTVRPTPVVSVDMTASQPYPTTYGLQVQIVGGATLTLLNGSQTVYYSASAGPQTRLVAVLDAKANGLITGWYDVNLVVTANFVGGSTTSTVPTRLLVDDESKSSFGAGWSLGIPRIYTGSGYSVLIAEGDGSMSFFRRDSLNGLFISPPGDPTKLTAVVDSLARYRRTNLDGSYLDFTSNGRLWRAVAPFNTTTTLTLTWTDTLLTSIRDVAGKVINLHYAAGKLDSASDPAGRVTLYSIDTLLRKVTEPNGDTTVFAYDGLKRLTRMTDNAGAQTDIGYDTLSELATVSSPSFQDFTGTSVRQTKTFVSADRHFWQPNIPGTSQGAPKQTDASLLTGSVTDALGATTTETVDRFGLPLVVTAPRGQVTTFTRDTLGQPTRITNPNGHWTNMSYNGYLDTLVNDPWAGTNIHYDYNSANMLITIRGDVIRQDIYYLPAYIGGPNNGPVDSVYSGNTGSYASATGGTLVSRHRVNQWGQDTLVTDGQGHTTKYVYADTAQFGGVTQIIDPLGNIVEKHHYDNLGRVDTSWTLASGTYAPTSVTYDLLNRTSTVKNALGYLTQYGYSSQGLTRVTDAKGQIYKFGFNALGMLVAQHDLADTTKADTTKYDIAGRVRRLRTRRGDVISFAYDSLRGNLLVRSGPDFPVDSFRYDSLGRWVVATDSVAYDSLNFDLRGRLSSAYERLTGATTYTLTYTYDGLDRLVTRSAPIKGTPVQLTYDATKGTITKLCAAAACASPQSYDADLIPHRTRFTDTLGHAAWSLVDTIDQRHLPTMNGFLADTTTSIDLSAFRRAWTYDSLHRLTGDFNPTGPTTYWAYDAMGELLISCYRSAPAVPCYDEYGGTPYGFAPPKQTYSFDSAGNRLDSLANAVVSAGNRTTTFRGYTLTYDANGNVLTKYGTSAQWGTDSSAFTWDALSRLKSVTTWPAGGAHTTVSFAYDALGRRVSKTVNGVTLWYAHDGDQVAMILDSLGQRLKLELGWAPGTDNLAFARGPSWTGVAMKTQQNGTVRGLVSPTPGAPIRKIYDSASAVTGATWGDMTADTGTIVPIRMGGAQFDQETKLYYMRARYYDPQLGRFMSEDPLGIAGGMNLYAYAENDPINGRDPTGLTMMTTCHYTDWYQNGKYIGTDTDYCLTYDDGGGLKGDPPGAGGYLVPGGDAHGGLGGSSGHQNQHQAPQAPKPTWGKCMSNAGAALVAVGGAVLAVGTHYFGKWITQEATVARLQGDVLINTFRTEPWSSGVLQEGLTMVQNGRNFMAIGETVSTQVAAGILAFAGAYFTTAAVICRFNPSYYGD